MTGDQRRGHLVSLLLLVLISGPEPCVTCHLCCYTLLPPAPRWSHAGCGFTHSHHLFILSQTDYPVSCTNQNSCWIAGVSSLHCVWYICCMITLRCPSRLQLEECVKVHKLYQRLFWWLVNGMCVKNTWMQEQRMITMHLVKFWRLLMLPLGPDGAVIS